MIPSRLRLLTINSAVSSDDGWSAIEADITAAVKMSGADVLSIQGQTQSQALKLANSLDGFLLVGGQRRWKEGARQGCLLVRSDTVDVAYSVEIPLSDTGDVQGVAAVATITVKESNGRPIVLASVDADPEHQRRRLDDIASVIRAVEDKAPDRRAGRVVLGSFYEAPDKGAYRLLTGRRSNRGVTGDFRDAYRRVGGDEAQGQSWRRGGDTLRADWIMVSQVEIQAAHLVVPEGEEKWKCLQHDPVYAELLL